MNLAKIRKKTDQARSAVPQPGLADDCLLIKSDIAEPVNSNGSSPVILPETVTTIIPEMTCSSLMSSPLARIARHDPVQRIMAGREAAGCHQEQQAEQQQIVNDYEEYLCFRLSDEIYGVSIMQLKEIIKLREVTEMPRAPEFVSGIISLRGVIIPILDMLTRLGLKRANITGKERIVVVKHDDNFFGLLVDEVLNVARIPKDCFEAVPAVLEGIDRDFVSGIGRAENRMIILLNLESITNINLF
jgi:purine-binding chemotaxis protein CheW